MARSIWPRLCVGVAKLNWLQDISTLTYHHLASPRVVNKTDLKALQNVKLKPVNFGAKTAKRRRLTVVNRRFQMWNARPLGGG